MFCARSLQEPPGVVWLAPPPGRDRAHLNSPIRLLQPTVPEADCASHASRDFSWSMVAGAASEQLSHFCLAGDADFVFE
jgi:hypothetical protein